MVTYLVKSDGVSRLLDGQGNFLTADPSVAQTQQYTLTAAQGTFTDTGGTTIVNYLNRQHVRLKRTIKGN